MKKLDQPFVLVGEDGRDYLLPTFLEAIFALSAFMKLVIFTNEAAYVLSASGRVRDTRMFMQLRCLARYAELYSPHYVFSPLLRFFFEQYRQHPICDADELKPFDRLASGMTVLEAYEDFVLTLRREAKETGLRKRHADWMQKFKKNAKRLRKLLDKLLQLYSRLVIIRLDLHLIKPEFSIDEIEKFMAEHYAQHSQASRDYWSGVDLWQERPLKLAVTLEDMQSSASRFFGNMKGKTSLFKHLVAKAYQYEFAPARGYHLHLILIFDGAHVHKHENLAQLIGEYFRLDITGGSGAFENCNRSFKPDEVGYYLGEINRDETQKIDNLMRYGFGYLTKPTQVVHMAPAGHFKMFGAGLVNRPLIDVDGRLVRGKKKPVVGDVVAGPVTRRGGRPRASTPLVPRRVPKRKKGASGKVIAKSEVVISSWNPEVTSDIGEAPELARYGGEATGGTAGEGAMS